MRVVHGSGAKFKYIAQTMARISDEGILAFNEDEMIGWIMSPDKTSLGVLKAPQLAFEEYSVERPLRLLIRTDELNKITKRATRNDMVVFEYEEAARLLKVGLHDRKTGINRVFYLPVISEAPPEMREIRIEATASFSMMSEDFKTIIQDSKTIGDIITIEAREDVLYVRTSGEGRHYEWEMREGEPLLELRVTEPTRSSYSMSSLEAALKPTGVADSVSIEFASNYPLKAEFAFPTSEKLYIYVAPTVE